MRFEAEVISDEILPAVRSIISNKLQQEYGLTQEEIASRLDVTQPAVSQYISGRRADQSTVTKLRDDPQIAILLNDAAGNAAQGEDFSDKIAKAVETIRDKGLLKEKFGDAEKL